MRGAIRTVLLAVLTIIATLAGMWIYDKALIRYAVAFEETEPTWYAQVMIPLVAVIIGTGLPYVTAPSMRVGAVISALIAVPANGIAAWALMDHPDGAASQLAVYHVVVAGFTLFVAYRAWRADGIADLLR